MKKLIAILLCLASLATMMACSGEKDSGEVATWKGLTDVKIFEEIPAPADAKDMRMVAQGDYGADNYVLELGGVMPQQHKDYLEVLKSAGYEVLVDNGATGIDNCVFATTFQKTGEDGKPITLTVSYAQSQMRMYLSATKYSTGISPFMTYNADDVAKNDPDAKTTLTMQQVPEYGNFFIIQLKNGHFILNDGGWDGGSGWTDNNIVRVITDVLLDMVPEGETAYVDAWFISHEHEDHMDFLKAASSVYDLDQRVRVEGFYVNQVSDEVKNATGAVNSVGKTVLYASSFKTAAGTETPVYRPHMGEKYYFNDVVVDIMYTQEQIVLKDYGLVESSGKPNLNNSSTWLMYHIEGQKFLLAGDAELVNMQYVMGTYSEDYMDVDIMNHHHHSLNIYTDDLNYYAKVDTLLFSTWGTYSIYWPSDVLANNLKIEAMGIEYLSYVDGGKRFTFPYEVGTYETLEPLYPEQSARLVAREKEWRQAAGLE